MRESLPRGRTAEDMLLPLHRRTVQRTWSVSIHTHTRTPDRSVIPCIVSSSTCRLVGHERRPVSIALKPNFFFCSRRACQVCTPNATNSLWSHCQCVLADGVERGMLSINRMLPGPSIQVFREEKIKMHFTCHAIGGSVDVQTIAVVFSA